MRVKLEAASQEEFEEKRHAILKGLAGDKFSVRPVGAKPGEAGETPVYQAQREIAARIDADFQALLAEIVEEVDEIIG